MKRLTASRQLKRKCGLCQCGFNKGHVYYKDRKVVADDIWGGIFVIEHTRCPKCKFKEDSHNERFEQFKENCVHPIVDLQWSYISGEYVMQPDHDECRLCGTWV